MQIREENLTFAQKWEFHFERLLHLDDQLGAPKNVRCKIDNLRASTDVFVIRVAGTHPGIFFCEDGMAAPDQLLGARRQERNALFLFLKLLRNADDHANSDE